MIPTTIGGAFGLGVAAAFLAIGLGVASGAAWFAWEMYRRYRPAPCPECGERGLISVPEIPPDGRRPYVPAASRCAYCGYSPTEGDAWIEDSGRAVRVEALYRSPRPITQAEVDQIREEVAAALSKALERYGAAEVARLEAELMNGDGSPALGILGWISSEELAADAGAPPERGARS